METYSHGATFHPRSCVRLTLYRDGFVLDSGAFRGYGELVRETGGDDTLPVTFTCRLDESLYEI